ncbi:MAG: SGNH/GDSL hydrolase family protein [Verrucomicrobiales bacterium]|nr:SGNH/GDSL hydrolase family protein [Verrucomicrobiales bacterium]
MKNRIFPALCVVLFFPAMGWAQEGVITPGKASMKVRKSNPAFARVVDDPALPRVLIIGDSISISYTAPTRDLLQGNVNLHRIPGNAGHTGMGLAGLPKWLDEKKGTWDLIYFNWGLWDLCYRNPKSKNQGNRDKVNGTLTHTPEVYAANLEKIVKGLKKSGAVLIFATTTPVPEGELGRKVGDDLVYNEAAMEVMSRHGVKISDLHSVMAGKMNQYGKAPGDVHFTEEGAAVLARAVAESIEANLSLRKD